MQNMDEILDHGQDYDGIKEYDNPLPRWFLLMFYCSIVFAFLYTGYHTAKARAIAQATGLGANLAWSGALLAAQTRAAEGARGEFEAPDHDDLVPFLKTPGNIARGEALFKANCVACHGEQAQGLIGPNLTDKFWIHGGAPDSIIVSITGGWPEKGMPGWKLSLGPEKVYWLAAYVTSIKGRSVTNPKEPQGTEE